jgi:hypothetical protein
MYRPFRKRKRWVRGENTALPVTSAGIRSGVHWMREKGRSRLRARAFARHGLPRARQVLDENMPWARRATRSRSIVSGFPGKRVPRKRRRARRPRARVIGLRMFGRSWMLL